MRFLNQPQITLQGFHLFVHFRDLFRGQALDHFVFVGIDKHVGAGGCQKSFCICPWLGEIGPRRPPQRSP